MFSAAEAEFSQSDGTKDDVGSSVLIKVKGSSFRSAKDAKEVCLGSRGTNLSMTEQSLARYWAVLRDR